MSERGLIVLLAGREIGRIRRDRRGHLTFVYEEAWRSFDGAFPLSLSMPLASEEHGHERIDAFLWGLLPDNQLILEGWAKRFHVSPRNAFSLLTEVGEDCAGAVQFVRLERLEELMVEGAPEVQWLDDEEVTKRLSVLRRDRSAWRSPGDTGQFSLTGAQGKTALFREGERWGVPSGRTPTTHILKPPMVDLDGSVENEHLCLQLAREVGLPTARSEVMRFGDEVVIVIERFDRARTAELAAAAAAESAAWAASAATGTEAAEAAQRAAAAAARAASLGELAKSQPVLRLHQEDLCQALGVHPRNKYQNEGGPSPERIVDLIRTHSSRPAEDVATFVDALAFNWLIAGTDGHAKNYSLLHGVGGRIRLAPLYDIISSLSYDELDCERLKLAMKIGGAYRIRDIGLRHWRSLAGALHLDPREVVERVSELASRVNDRVDVVRRESARQGLTHPIIDRLAESLAQRTEKCGEQLREG